MYKFFFPLVGEFAALMDYKCRENDFKTPMTLHSLINLSQNLDSTKASQYLMSKLFDFI
jgi:hypothetical protein